MLNSHLLHSMVIKYLSTFSPYFILCLFKDFFFQSFFPFLLGGWVGGDTSTR